MKSNLFIYFSYVSLARGDIFNKKLPSAMPGILLSIFSSIIFMVLGLTFNCLTHFQFILVCGVRRWSGFIFLHIYVQISQHHLLNKLSLAHCMCLLPLSNINWLNIKVWIYFWALYSVPLIFLSVFMPVPCCFDYYCLVV